MTERFNPQGRRRSRYYSTRRLRRSRLEVSPAGIPADPKVTGSDDQASAGNRLRQLDTDELTNFVDNQPN